HELRSVSSFWFLISSFWFLVSGYWLLRRRLVQLSHGRGGLLTGGLIELRCERTRLVEVRGRGAGVAASSEEPGGIEGRGDGRCGCPRRLEVAHRGAEVQFVDLDASGQGLATS